MPPPTSAVLAFPPDMPEATAAAMAAKLSHHTDAWDLAEDLANGIQRIVVIDTRSSAKYLAGHIPGAISLPHRDMTLDRLGALAMDRVYITYCDGIGCNASTKGAWQLARHGLRVKELLGGLDFWKRDGHPVVSGDAPGDMLGHVPGDCGCA
ncbi:rhodanese [Halomonas sp. McH1-25]|uniref:rhodanese-like domain-containing protein n=1 Tax=unclassified Halomonas TaxID=2609666 RepID=UPI001EF62EC8|nr:MULTISPECIES: rhodanese-like domain-containing protein [unclassified Halomonas]MCG7599833.1 rhodanese [Halomonas sp. McH1-25]MCP1341728.1 rhodanese-like domain-containing protein [Halomonas sp. FL8]MCP1362078.1 rhodanese-like domain-containing protein [Halomonas sp. BBD45]MCP1367545.1 rhodanese-like domain-containing protein [Halomonas sp. BBD48]